MQPDTFEDDVLELVERVPAGRVVTYGLIAEYLERGGPRQVARVMAHSGGTVPWWRVVCSDGSLPRTLADRARQEYLGEATPLRPNGAVDVRAALWVPQDQIQV